MKKAKSLTMFAGPCWRTASPPPPSLQARPRSTVPRFGIASLPRRSGATSSPLRADVPARKATPLLKEGGSVFSTALAFGSVALKSKEQSQDDGFALSLSALGCARRERGSALVVASPLCGLAPPPLHAFRRVGSVKSLRGFYLRKARKGLPLWVKRLYAISQKRCLKIFGHYSRIDRKRDH